MNNQENEIENLKSILKMKDQRIDELNAIIYKSNTHVNDAPSFAYPFTKLACACGNAATHQCNFASNEVCHAWLCSQCKHEHSEI